MLDPPPPPFFTPLTSPSRTCPLFLPLGVSWEGKQWPKGLEGSDEKSKGTWSHGDVPPW